MTKPVTDILDVVVHCEATGALGVVPLEIDSCEFCCIPIRSDFVVFIDCGKEVFGVMAACILDGEVVNN